MKLQFAFLLAIIVLVATVCNVSAQDDDDSDTTQAREKRQGVLEIYSGPGGAIRPKPRPTRRPIGAESYPPVRGCRSAESDLVREERQGVLGIYSGPGGAIRPKPRPTGRPAIWGVQNYSIVKGWRRSAENEDLVREKRQGGIGLIIGPGGRLIHNPWYGRKF